MTNNEYKLQSPNDQMPTEGVEVLLYDGRWWVGSMYMVEDQVCWYQDGEFCDDEPTVELWAPLPTIN